MPWLKREKKRPIHQCKMPWVPPWRKPGSKWQCPKCGYVWSLIKGLGYGKDWNLYDSRGIFDKDVRLGKSIAQRGSTLPPLHGGYRPCVEDPDILVRGDVTKIPKPPGGQGGGSK